VLDDRKAVILRALVEEYIRTGEPVSSRAILDRSRLVCSSATVRAELSDMEIEGYVAKPHTSAGRIPTDAGYRYYIDHLSPGSLQLSVRHRIEGFFSTVHTELRRLLKDTSDLLADITHYPAVVVGPALQGQTVRDVHLIPVDPAAVLLLLVTDGGQVRQTVLRLDSPVTPLEVSRAQDALAELVLGETLDDRLTSVEVTGLEQELPAPSAGLVDRALAAVEGVASGQRDLFIGGASLMVSLWEDLAKLHRVLAILEQEASLLSLIDDRAVGTSVRLGRELSADEADLAVVSSGFGRGDAPGRMGVIGPMRMDYRRTIRVVEEISEALDEQFDG
jgi:heat-inducible transcriptional repressor